MDTIKLECEIREASATVTITGPKCHRTVELTTPDGSQERQRLQWALDTLRDGVRILLMPEPPAIPIPGDRPTHGGYSPLDKPWVVEGDEIRLRGASTPLPLSKLTLPELQESFAVMEARNAEFPPTLGVRESFSADDFTEGQSVFVRKPSIHIASRFGYVKHVYPGKGDVLVQIGGVDHQFACHELAPIKPEAPSAIDPRLKILSDFARTAPGRLPQEVQDALIE